jgi:hypothetical protein
VLPFFFCNVLILEEIKAGEKAKHGRGRVEEMGE